MMTRPAATEKPPIAIQVLANPRLPTSKAYVARPASMSVAVKDGSTVVERSC
jgi:hypothetical protein